MTMAEKRYTGRRSRQSDFECSETGDTLVEILIAIAILGVAVTALLGALVTSITSASEHRSLASNDTVIRSYAEQLKYDIELQPNAWFTQCAQVTSTTYGVPPNLQTVTPPPNLPAGYTVGISGIQYWNDVNNKFVNDSSAACQSNANDQSGFQLLTMQVTAPNGVVETLSMGVRQP
jgi:type II secretory pathway pseudopilin PulG